MTIMCERTTCEALIKRVIESIILMRLIIIRT